MVPEEVLTAGACRGELGGKRNLPGWNKLHGFEQHIAGPRRLSTGTQRVGEPDERFEARRAVNLGDKLRGGGEPTCSPGRRAPGAGLSSLAEDVDRVRGSG